MTAQRPHTCLAAVVSHRAAAAPPTGKNCSGSADRHSAWSDHSTPTPPRGASPQARLPRPPGSNPKPREHFPRRPRALLESEVLGHDQSKIITEGGADRTTQ